MKVEYLIAFKGLCFFRYSFILLCITGSVVFGFILLSCILFIIIIYYLLFLFLGGGVLYVVVGLWLFLIIIIIFCLALPSPRFSMAWISLILLFF